MTRKIARFLANREPATPCLVVDLDVVAASYRKLRTAMPDAVIYYAVKANPAREILELLARLGSSFDTASLNEIDMVLAAGGTADRISFGNTIKKTLGHRRRLRARSAPVRLRQPGGAGEDRGRPLREAASSAAFSPPARAPNGRCRVSSAASLRWRCELLRLAKDLDVVPWGISFHVGSQQRDPRQWDRAIAEAARMFRDLEQDGIELGMLNIGGGFPARYRRDIPTLCRYGACIRRSILKHFGNRVPDVIVEPGRQMVGNAGIIQTEVVLIAKKSANDPRRWVFLDIGKFGGLAETEGEAIQYPIRSPRRGRAERVILAGPTCNSADVLYERANYRLPVDLSIGDRLQIRSTGAYTSTYASVAFNGFEPLRCYCI